MPLLEFKYAAIQVVRENGAALVLASPDIRADPDVVMTAVCGCGLALQSAAPELRADINTVSMAVYSDGRALA